MVLFILTSLLICINLILYAINKKYAFILVREKKMFIWSINLSVFVLCIFFFLPAIEKKLLSHKLNTFISTIDALQTFKEKNGYYPHDLSYLTPSYVQMIPSEKELLHYDTILYESNGKNGKYSTKFIGGSPEFTFIFFKSYSVGGQKEIQYCPVRYECRYEVDFPKKVGNKVVLEKRIMNPNRIDNSWIYVESY